MVAGPVPRRCWWRVVSPATSPRLLERYKKADDYGHEKRKKEQERGADSVFILAFAWWSVDCGLVSVYDDNKS